MIKYIIHEIIDWVPSFSLLDVLIQKECFFCFIWVLKVSLRLTLIQKRCLYRLRLLPLIRDLFVPLQGIAPESSWLRGAFFEGQQKYMQNKNEGKENKIMLRDLNCTIDKIDTDSENKTQRLHRCCSNYARSKFIVDNGIEDPWKRET